MPRDDAWRRDLHLLLEAHGARLRALADRLAADDRSADARADRDPLADALTEVFTTHRPERDPLDATRSRGTRTVVVVDGDGTIDALDRAVAAALERRARERRPGEHMTEPSADDDDADAADDAADDTYRPGPPPLDPAVLAAVEARVAAARRARAGHRRLAATVALATGVALAVGAAWSAGYGPGRATPGPTMTVAEDAGGPVAFPPPHRGTAVACGTRLDVRETPTGGITLRVRGTTRMAPGGTWSGTVTADVDATVRAHAALVDAPQLVLVSGRGEPVAAVGVGDVDRLDLTGGDPVVHGAVRFPSCAGTRPLGPGVYGVVAVQRYQDRGDWPYGPVYTAVSAPASVTVAGSVPPTDARGARATQPPWLAGTPVACGMADDALTLLPGYFPQYLDELATPADRPVGVVVHNVTGGPAPLTAGRRAAVAWVQDGRVVSVGADVLADPVTRVVPVHGELTIAARLDTTDWCRPDRDGRYPHRLRAGTYLAVPYVQVVEDHPTASATGRRTVGWLVGVPRGVVVGADGSVHADPAQDG